MSKKIFTGWKDKVLFTPGPLTTSRTVKQAMLRDLGSRDYEFIELVKEVRNRLLAIGNVQKGEYETILMQGSGTFGLESVVASTIPRGGKLLVIINGAYGRRIAQMAFRMGIETVTLEYPENVAPHPEDVAELLEKDKYITNVSVVHCETTTGIINPIEEIGKVVKAENRIYFVDAITTFGAIPIDLKALDIDYTVAAPNKCLEGVPGFSIIIAKKEELIKTEGYSRSLSLDLLAQWNGLEIDGQFRFTPPIHAVLALWQALDELDDEGGVEGRAKRYKANCETLIHGMRKMGFREYLFPNLRGYIITSYLHHDHPNYSFDKFYKLLSDKDQIIYPGKLSTWDGFRIGTIGRIFPSDIKTLLASIQESLFEMGVITKAKIFSEYS